MKTNYELFTTGWCFFLEHEFYFPFHTWDVILPIVELIFFQDGSNHQPDK